MAKATSEPEKQHKKTDIIEAIFDKIALFGKYFHRKQIRLNTNKMSIGEEKN